jgi:hypothetical protein
VWTLPQNLDIFVEIVYYWGSNLRGLVFFFRFQAEYNLAGFWLAWTSREVRDEKVFHFDGADDGTWGSHGWL